jgi:hypothetical protein
LQALREIGEVDVILIGRPSFITDEHLQVLRDEYGMIAHGVPTHPSERGIWPIVQKYAGRTMTKRLAHNIDGSRSRLRPDQKLIHTIGGALDLKKYDLVFGRYANALGNVGFPYLVPTVLDVDDLDTDVYESRIKLASGPFQRAALGWHKHNIELGLSRVIASVDHAFVANPSNREFPGLEGASVLPNIPFSQSDDVRPYVAPDVASKTVMVIGSYDYDPNVEGVDWLVEKVWPSVVQVMPEARLKIYGSNMSAAMRKRWSAVLGVDVIGFADSLESAYKDATLSVCPVLRGAGSNIKVIESAAHGRVCLLTEASARGYQDDPDLEPLLPVASSSGEMSANILRYLSAGDELDAMSKRLHEVAHTKYSRSHFISVVKDGVQSAISHSRVSV